jgi:hypothetical protein
MANWLTDWEEARKHPWKARLFLLVGFGALGIWLVLLAGGLHSWRAAAVGAVVAAGLGVAGGEVVLQRGLSVRRRTARAHLGALAVITVSFAAAVVVGFVIGSGLVAGLLALVGVVLMALTLLQR